MNKHQITQEDIELMEEARNIIRKHFWRGRHHVGAALRTKTGRIITGINIETYIRKGDICAEAITLGRAILEGEYEFDTIVAVRHPYPHERDQEIKVVSPCGTCRELIYDYGANIKVIILNQGILEKYVITDLLPFKYRK